MSDFPGDSFSSKSQLPDAGHPDAVHSDAGAARASGSPELHLSALSSIRTYEDQAALDRVWKRMSVWNGGSARASRRSPLLFQGMAAVALLALGTFVGMQIERSRSPELTFELASENLQHPLEVSAANSDLDRSGRDQGRVRAPAGSRLNSSARRSGSGAPQERTKAAQGRQAVEQQGARVAASSLSAADLSSGAELNHGAEGTALDVSLQAAAVSESPKAAWLVLAERGDFSGAFQQLDQAGGFDAALLSAGPEELMTLVDVARTMGRQGRAIQALRIVVNQYRDDENAPLAAMMLGNLLGSSGDAAGAAEAFALNRQLSPEGDFAEDALVREFDMAVAALDLPRAQELKDQYLREYSSGRHRPALEADIERLALELQAVEGSSADRRLATEQSVNEQGEKEGGAKQTQPEDDSGSTDQDAAADQPSDSAEQKISAPSISHSKE